MKGILTITAILLIFCQSVFAQANQPPVLFPIGNKVVSEGYNLSFTVSATDSESIPSLTASPLPSGATFGDNGNGSGDFSWTPTLLQAGLYEMIFRAIDDSSAVDSELISITVLNIADPPQIVSVSPARNELNVDDSSTISVTFDKDMDESTINNSTFVVRSEFMGTLNGTYSYDDVSHTATFASYIDFGIGDIISVSLTTGIESSDEIPLINGYNWCFTAEVDSGHGVFSGDNSYQAGPAGSYPISICTADLNGDDILDLAVSNSGCDSITVFLGAGDGTFSLATRLFADNATAIVACDIDLDADIDLIAANSSDDSLSILTNVGGGVFQWSNLLSTYVGDNPSSITAADFNGDGWPDLAVTGASSNDISLLINDHTGSFSNEGIYNTGNSPLCVESGDFDDDGDIDLVNCNNDDGSVSFFLNRGNGIFDFDTTYIIGGSPFSIAVADFVGNGFLDLAITDYDGARVVVLINDESGAYVIDSSYDVGTQPHDIIAGDFQHTGNLSLANVNFNSNDVSVLLNAGDTTFIQPPAFSTGIRPNDLCAGDFDSDGDLDMAITSVMHNRIYTYKNDIGTPTTYVVTRLDDDENEGSLRWAINQSNNATPFQSDSIIFSPSLNGTIYLNDTLPAFVDPMGAVIIGDTLNPESIIINGTQLPNRDTYRDDRSASYGFYIKNINEFFLMGLVFSNFEDGIIILNSSNIDLILIGVHDCSENGVAISSSSSINMIGCTMWGLYNDCNNIYVYACNNIVIDNNSIGPNLENTFNGVGIVGIYVTSSENVEISNNVFGYLENAIIDDAGWKNYIHDNYIGMNTDYEHIPITGDGIRTTWSLDARVEYNTICASNTGILIENAGELYFRNVFYGNSIGNNNGVGEYGIIIMGQITENTRIEGNSISGLNKDAILVTNAHASPGYSINIFSNNIGSRLGNGSGEYGINVIGSTNVYIKGNNIVSNGFGGIEVNQSTLYIENNDIGFYAIIIPNGNHGSGIIVENCTESPVGIRGNRIAYNEGNGIEIINSSNVSVNWENEIFSNWGSGIILSGAYSCNINNNLIGNNSQYSSCGDYPNGSDGITIIGNSTFNSIGPGNTIVCNNRDGIRIIDENSINNKIRENSIYSNGGLGIDLGGDGVTANDDPDDPRVDPDTGPNDLINFPVIESISSGSTSAVKNVHGVAGANCGIDLYIVGDYGNPTGHGDAYEYFGSSTADGNGNFTIADVPLGAEVTATATNNNGNGSTSEFSENYFVMHECWVTTNIDNLTTPGTLRAAIIEANENEGPDIIKFLADFPGPIVLETELPALSDITGGTIIDGGNGECGIPKITIDGINLSSGNGLTLESDDNEILGMAIINFPENGIKIAFTSDNNKINGNYIGTGIDGTIGGNYYSGIAISGSNNKIGTICGNVISNNNLCGIWNSMNHGQIISNNKIGTNATGTSINMNSGNGIELQGCSEIQIDNNTISGNGAANLWASDVAELYINDNKIGTSSDGNSVLIPGLIHGSGGLYLKNINIGSVFDNLISGNWDYQIKVINCSILGLSGNNIGTVHPVVETINYGYGILIDNCSNLQIGGNESGQGNIIARNKWGIEASGTNLIINGNTIRNNGSGGLYLGEGSQNCQIINNTITGNKYNVRLYHSSTDHNLISKNIIYQCQDGPDIDLYPWGISPIITGWDDVLSPNNKRRYPDLHYDGTNNTLIAQFPAIDFPINGKLEIFAVSDYDPESGDTLCGDFNQVDSVQNVTRNHGGAIEYLGEVNCGNIPGDIVINLADLEAIDNDQVELEVGDKITALAIDANNNTSEYSNNVVILNSSFEVSCPILLEVEDPIGYIINSETNEIMGSSYDHVTDINGDGDPDHRIFLNGAVAGEYKIRISPSSEAGPGDTYTLKTIVGNDTTLIIEEAPVPGPGNVDEYTYGIGLPNPCDCVPGDVQADGSFNLLDILYLISYLYNTPAGPAPVPYNTCSGDPGCDCVVNLLDILYLIGNIYGTPPGPAPCTCEDWMTTCGSPLRDK